MKREFLRFVAIGVFSTIINYSSFYVLLQVLGVHYLVSSGSGFLLGVVAGFPFNKNWAFEVNEKSNKLMMVKYLMVYLISLGLSLAFLRFCIEVLMIPVLPANVLAIGLSTLTNFTGLKLLVFNLKTIGES